MTKTHPGLQDPSRPIKASVAARDPASLHGPAAPSRRRVCGDLAGEISDRDSQETSIDGPPVYPRIPALNPHSFREMPRRYGEHE